MLRSTDTQERSIEKLLRINQVLVDRIDRLEETRGSAWSMFQAAMALEQEVQARTRDLEQAMADLSLRNQELAVARAAAEEANRSKTRFLRAASHDLLQPLAAARLFVSMLAETEQGAEQAELTARISNAFESVEELMHAVLDISRLDSQRIEFHRKPVPLSTLFKRLADEYTPLAEAKGLRLRFVPTGIVVTSDPVFLRRIAQNLVSNAIKYTEKGGALIGVRARGERAWLEVYDTGTGIAPADRGRIFEEFQRLGADGQVPGMGLGLSIVRRACAKLGHPITIDSTPGRGTVFRIGLPMAAPVQRDPEPGPTAIPPALRGRVILVVENDAEMRRGYELILRDRMGMVPRLAGSTAEALATMGDEPPDIVLADYNLEGGDNGLHSISALRERAGLAVPALMITARRDPEIARACGSLGVPLLEKPLRPADLQTTMEKLLA